MILRNSYSSLPEENRKKLEIIREAVSQPHSNPPQKGGNRLRLINQKLLTFIMLCALLSSPFGGIKGGFAQTWFNASGGAKISINKGTGVAIEGNLYNDTSAVIRNSGIIGRTDFIKNYGTVDLQGDSAYLTVDSILYLEKGKVLLNENSVVIYNKDTFALQRTDGYLIAEDSMWGSVQWHINDNSGTYAVPFYTDSLDAVSVLFDVLSPGDSLGYMTFSTYPASDVNEPKPSDLFNYVYASRGVDSNATKIVDRYWKFEALGYNQNPASRVTLRYTDNEFTGNTIAEDSMEASGLLDECWNDWQKVNGTINASENKFSIDSLSRYNIIILHDSVNWEKTALGSHYAKLVSPAPQIVNSDTPHTFTFSVSAKYWGNQIEWAFDSTFASSQTGASPYDIEVTLDPGTDTLMWLRARDSTTGCVTQPVTTIAYVDSFPVQDPPTDTLRTVCAGTVDTVKIENSDGGLLYKLRIDTTVISSSLGNNSLLSLVTGAIDTSTLFNIFTTDTLTGDTATLDTIVYIMAIDSVETPIFALEDTFIHVDDSVCFFAVAENSTRIIYDANASTTIDSITGCVSNVTGDFTVKATAYGLPECGSKLSTLSVKVTDISAPEAPEYQTQVVDSPQVIEFTFEDIEAGEGGNQIEWANNINFDSSTILSSPATIDVSLMTGSDTAIYLRSRKSSTGEVSKIKRTGARNQYALLSAGLLDKSGWEIVTTKSDEFDYSDTRDVLFQQKWHLFYCNRWNPCLQPDPGCVDHDGDHAYYNTAGDINGSNDEVEFDNGIMTITATELPTPYTRSCIDEQGAPVTKSWPYKSGLLQSRMVYDITKPGLFEIRCKTPAGLGANPAFWLFEPRITDTEIDIFEMETRYPLTGETDKTLQSIHDWSGNWPPVLRNESKACTHWFEKQTPCVYSSDWHTYSCMFSSNEVIFFVDGKETWSQDRASVAFPSVLPIDMIILINLAITTQVETSYQFQVDYVRYYEPIQGNTSNPPNSLLNRNNNDLALTLESPNWLSTNNNHLSIPISNNSDGVTIEIPTSSTHPPKISSIGTGDNIKVFYQGEGANAVAHMASINSGNWIETRMGNLTSGGVQAPRVKGYLTPTNAHLGPLPSTLVYYQGRNNELMYYINSPPSTGWGVHSVRTGHNQKPVNNCAGYIHIIGSNNRVMYKGTDGHVWSWRPLNFRFPSPSALFQYRINLNYPNPNGAIAINKTGTILFYIDANGNLRQLYGGALPLWKEISQPVVDIPYDITNNLAIDDDNSRVFFTDLNGAVWYYNWNYNTINLSGLVKLGNHDIGLNPHYNDWLCDGNYNAIEFFQDQLLLSHDKDEVYYKGKDGRLWYYFNDKENSPGFSKENWNKTLLDPTYSPYALGTVEASEFGRLFYVDEVGNLSFMDWVNADNMLECPDNDNWYTFASYKADSIQVSEDSQQYQGKDDLNVVIYPNPSGHVFNIKITNLDDEEGLYMQIEDLSGKKVDILRKTLPSESSWFRFEWNAQNIQDGIYIYHLLIGTKSVSGKLIKM